MIETGLFGLLAVVMFLAWFVSRAGALWRGERGNSVALAASVAIGVELIHSLADYPLRTAAMSSIMAVACVLLVRPADQPRGRNRRRHEFVEADGPRKLIRI